MAKNETYKHALQSRMECWKLMSSEYCGIADIYIASALIKQRRNFILIKRPAQMIDGVDLAHMPLVYEAWYKMSITLE